MRFPLALALVATLLVAPVAHAGWRGEGPFTANVTDLAFAPKAPGTVYAATSGGGVWRSDDGGKSWKAIGQGLGTIGIRQLFFDAADSKKVWATGGTFATVLRSLDGGDNWARAAEGWKGDEVEAVVVDPAKGAVYAGTFSGGWRSTGGGTNWAARNDGLRNLDIRALAIAGKSPRLWAGVAGGSVVSIELP